MIKRISLKWVAVIAAFLSFFPSLWAGSSDSLLVKLNQTIEQRPSYMQRKEEALETLRQSLRKLSAGNMEGRMNLYEALWNAAGAVFLVWLGRFLARREGAVGGRLMWAYLMVYTSGRVWIELLRVDEAHRILGLRLNVWTSILVFLIGLAGYVMTSRRHLSDAISEGTEEGDGPRAESEAADRPNEMAETSVSAGPEPQEAHTKSEMKPDAGD